MDNRRLLILYGSQTGTAQELAERIWREGKRYHLSGPVMPMDDYPIGQLIYETLVVFVCSTTGQGEEPDNMKLFWKFLLRKNLPSDSLKSMRFGVLGLGDSSYTKFNHAAKKLFRRLAGLGATALLTVGLADDQHDLGADAVIDPWIEQLWKHILTERPLPPNVSLQNADSIFPRWHVSIDSNINNSFVPHVPSKLNAVDVQVKGNIRTTNLDHFQDVRLISFSHVPASACYKPGDVLMILPQNLPENVNILMDLLTGEDAKEAGSVLSPDSTLSVKMSDPDMPVPEILQTPMSLRTLATYYWDLSAVPRRFTLQILAQITPNDLEREKLLELASSEGQEEMFNYLNRPRRTVLELLADFPHAVAHFPYTLLFELLTPIRPRAFSIASSPQAHKEELHVLVAVVKYKTKLVTPRFGLCSNWMASLNPGVKVPVWIRQGSLRFPADKHIPIIMVGPGTGVAPFRSYIHERISEGTATSNLLHLFFGCRNKCGDFHCSDEWMSMQDAKHISLYCAFSRDQEDKVYVQHVISQNSNLVWQLISKGAYVFVAGNSNNMPASVREAVKESAVNHGGMSEDDAENVLLQMEQSQHYQTETWA